MIPPHLTLYEYYIIDDKKYRYMGRNTCNQYVFYNSKFDMLLLDDTEIYLVTMQTICKN